MSPRNLADSARPGSRDRQRRKAAPKDTVAIIDELLQQPRSMLLDGEQVSFSTLEVIVLQLLQQEMKGSSRARQILLQYQQFGAQHSERRQTLYFAESDYTKALAAALAESLRNGG
jgi:hypothetical protein